MSRPVDALLVLDGDPDLPAGVLERYEPELRVTAAGPAAARAAARTADVVACDGGTTVDDEPLVPTLSGHAPVVVIEDGPATTDGGSTTGSDLGAAAPFPDGAADVVRRTTDGWRAVLARRLLAHGRAARAASRDPDADGEGVDEEASAPDDRVGTRRGGTTARSPADTVTDGTGHARTPDLADGTPDGAAGSPDRLRDLLDVAGALAGAPDEVAVARIVLRAVREVLGATSACYYTHESGDERLVPLATTDDLDPASAPTLGPGDSAWDVFREGEPLLVAADDAAEACVPAGAATEGEVLLLPLGDRALVVAATAGPDGTPRLDHAAVLADHAATALARVAERETLRDRQRTLREENERLEGFTRAVSHDLRNPLNVVLGRLELYRETGDPDHVEDAAVAAERMQELVEDLLSLAREGRTDGDRQPMSLADLARRALRSVDEELALDATDHVVESDPGRLQELLENLARNAAEHGDATTLRVGPLDDGGFYVGDDGTGIPPDRHDRVFEPGYTTADEGTGFGLAIVRAIAEAHDWRVTLTDGVEGGARFEFRPVDEGAAGPTPADGR